MKLLRLLFIFGFLIISIPGSSFAEPFTQLENVPEELKEWIPWVRDRHPEWNCISVSGKFECLWPGHFDLALEKQGARFSLSVEVQKRTVLPLPGGGEFLPHGLTVKSEQGAAVEHGYRLFMQAERPAVELPPGRYVIEGSFAWDKQPQDLTVPSAYGLLNITGAGKNIRRAGDSIIFAKEVSVPQSSQFYLSVGRRIEDGSPVNIITLLEVRYSGEAQTLNVGNVLVDGSLPVEVQSALPFQLSTDGTLSLQVRPGSHQVRIVSVLPQPVHSIKAPRSSLAAWPKHEFWSWKTDTEFRSIEVEGAVPANPEITNLPEEWRRDALYMVQPGSSITLKELRRGEDRQLENSLTLSREFWLQLDGTNFIVRDTFRGAMFREFRLNALPELKLASATVDGKPVLISEKDGRGFEVRKVNLSAQTLSLLEPGQPISALGWDLHSTTVSGHVNLSPGWKLIHIFGTESVGGSWLQSWTLLDIFIGLLLVIGSAKFFGTTAAAVAAVALVITHGEYLAPRMLLIHVVIGMALLELSHGAKGAWRQWIRAYVIASFFGWSVQVATFIKLQLTELVYPQLAAGTRYRTFLQKILLTVENHFLVWLLLFLLGLVGYFALRFVDRGETFGRTVARLLLVTVPGVFVVIAFYVFFSSAPYQDATGEIATTTGTTLSAPAPARSETIAIGDLVGSRSGGHYKLQLDSATADLEQEVKGRVAQSGPGLPSWQWKRHSFYIKGPVDSDHQIRFVLLSPAMNRALSLLRPLLAALLTFLLFLRMDIKLPRFQGPASAALLLLVLLMPSSRVQAETPDAVILQELEERLLKTVCTAEQCAQLENLAIQIEGRRAVLGADVQSLGQGAVVLPGPLEQLPVREVLLDDTQSPAMRRDDKGFLWVQVPNGKHRLTATAELPVGDSITVQVPMRPFHASFSSEDWEIEGLLPTGAVKSPIRLVAKSRTATPEPKMEAKQSVILPTWFHVERDIVLGEDTRGLTKVTRQGDLGRNVAARIPLLPGERVTSRIQIEDGHAIIRFSPGLTSLSYESALGEARELKLNAQESETISEKWRIKCSTFMSCVFSGLRPTKTTELGEQVHVFMPFPGEEVSVRAEPLAAAPGETLTVESLYHVVTWGPTRLDGEVSAKIRVTEQQSFTLTLPADAEVVQANIVPYEGGGIVQNEQVSFLLNPGSENEIKLSYRLPSESGLIKSLPKLGFNHPVYNVDLRARPPGNSWMIWTGGLRWGPAVLFWPKLIFVMLILVALAKLQLLPLSILDAVLFSLGLSTLPLVYVGVPLLWLFCLRFSEPFAERISLRYRTLALSAFLALTALALASLYQMVRIGLVLAPPVLVAGNSSRADFLRWYTDIATEHLPEVWFVVLPMWCWRVLMLCWATWLAVRLLSWLVTAGKVVKDVAAYRSERGAAEPSEP